MSDENAQTDIRRVYHPYMVISNQTSYRYTGMSIRMAQDMGLFRDVDKWLIPNNTFTRIEKQTRRRVWWTCVMLDKYVSTYIGRPMMVFERDYDTAFASQDEPDEHEPWKAMKPDGTRFTLKRDNSGNLCVTEDEPVVGGCMNSTQEVYSEEEVKKPITDLCSTLAPDALVNSNELLTDNAEPAVQRSDQSHQASYLISCFNRSASLSVLISRIIANIYAIRIRVIGQSSEALLALLDQNLAHWYLDLPEHLHYNPITLAGRTLKRPNPIPTPHLLTLHAQFYTALILLHRPFIPSPGCIAKRPESEQDGKSSDTPHPSHSICTTSANAIANIAKVYSETFGLRQAPAFMVYYIFTAAIMHVGESFAHSFFSQVISPILTYHRSTHS